MTVLIQQKTLNDCALAAIAMAAGKEAWEDLWTEADLEAVKGKGVADIEPYMLRAGMLRKVHYRTAYIHANLNPETLEVLLWGRRALLSVHSLNSAHNNHMIYWDGERLWDPSYERTYLHLRSCVVSTVHTLKD